MTQGLVIPADLDFLDPRTWAASPPQDFRIYASNSGVSALVDEAVYPHLARYAWNCFTTRSCKTYFRRSKSVRRADGSKTVETILLHREIMRLRGIEPPDRVHRYVVDHEDSNELDCRGANLRWATYLQNNLNRRSL